MLTKNILTGKRIRLDVLREEDMPSLSQWYQDGDFARQLELHPVIPRSQKQLTEEWVEQAQKSNTMYAFAIRTISQDEFIGMTELAGIQWSHGNSWVGLAIAPAFQNQGYGRETMELILRFAFHELNLHRIQLMVFGYNERAIKLYEKLGFQREGTYREFLKRDGQYFDVHLYGLLASEWEKSQGSTAVSI